MRRDLPGVRSGSASLLVLGILTACVALLTGAQVSLRSRSTELRIRQNELALRAAVQLGLREGMTHLAEDSVPAFDDPREDWATPLRFRSSDGVQLTVRISDAQNRFDLNRLAQPISPSMIRTPEDMFADLLSLLEFPQLRESARSLAQQMRKEESILQDPQQLMALDADFIEAAPYLAPLLSVLPPSKTGALTVNLNTVHPEVLAAILGPQFQGWIESVLSSREAAPIPSVQAVMTGLPPIVQSVLPQVVDVRSVYFEIWVQAEVDAMQSNLRTLVRRPSPGQVEVVRCRW